MSEFLLLDQNNVTGSLNDLCSLEHLKEMTSDCGGEEVTCDCCCICCSDDDGGPWCHQYALNHNDIDWETSYERRFFRFSSSGHCSAGIALEVQP